MSILDNFPLPEVASEAMRNGGLREVSLEDGVSRLMSGHDKGVSYRFFIKEVRNEVKSKITAFPVYDEVELVEWYVDRRTKPTERVRELPEALLRFDADGNCVGGRYKESYDRFKQGLDAPGMPLSKWGVLSDAEVAALSELGIFSVEQYAAQPRDKVASKFPASFMESFELAIEYVNGKDLKAAANKQAEKVVELAQENEQLKKDMQNLQAQVMTLLSGEQAPSDVTEVKRRGRPRKVTSEGGEE